MKKIRVCLLLLLLVPLSGTALWANISNQGNETVRVEFKRKTGSSLNATLFPGQSLATPPGTVEVKLVPRGMGARGDEIIQLQVVEPNGKIGVLTKFYESYKFGIEEDSDPQVDIKPGKIVNQGNVSLDIAVRRKNGLSDTFELYLEQTRVIPKDAYEVEILSRRRLRGDEIIQAAIIMPDGIGHTLNTQGGIARILPENQAAFNNANS